METIKTHDPIPFFVRPFLWSYDCDRLDLANDKKLIITNVLNFGTKEATDWVREHYSESDIRETIRTPSPGVWSKKSLHFWSMIYDTHSQVTPRFSL